MKTCTKCKLEKPLDDFSGHKSTKDGKHSWCRECLNAAKRELYASNEKHRTKQIAYQKSLRSDPQFKLHNKQYKKDYGLTLSGTITKLLCSAKRRAKVANIEFDLDREWTTLHLSSMKCEATGVDLTLKIDDTVMHSPFRPSIDRIDNSKAYTKDNCRITSVIYNKAKSDCTDEDVWKMAQSLVAFKETKQ